MIQALLPLTLALAAASPAQFDPPHDGTFTTYRDQIVTFSDFYRTYADIRIPNATPGPQGWPMLVFVHPTGTSRDTVEQKAIAMAQRGFVTVAYDVRGQGKGMTLNDPRFFGREVLGVRERLDLFEMMEAVEAQFPADVDFDRLGVTGKSQGGVHSWFAAAHSEELPPPNPWRSAPLPKITAVAPINFGTEFLEALVPDGENFSEMNVRQFYEDEQTSGIHNNPSVYALIEPYLADEDYAGLAQFLYNPSLDLDRLLADSDVAVLASLVYDDKYAPVQRMLPEWEKLFQNAPHKFLSLTTSGHSTPDNFSAETVTEYRRVRFFEETMKGIDHGLANWKPYRFSISPLDPREFADPNAVWSVVEADEFPIQGTTPLPLFLNAANGQLDLNPPVTETNRSLEHRPNGLTLDLYAQYLPRPEQLIQGVPLNSISFVSDPLPQGSLMIGSPGVRLHVGSLQEDYQVSVALFEDVSGRYLCSGSRTIRGNTSPTEQTIEIALGTTAVHLPAGSKIRVEIENLAWHRPFGQPSHLYSLPIFADFDLGLRFGGTDPAAIELPLVPLNRPVVTVDYPYFTRTFTGERNFELRAYENQAGWNYQLLASLSGTSPGFQYQGIDVPLNVDAVTQAIVKQPGSLPIQNFSGKLDGSGRARASIDMSLLGPLPPSLQTISACLVIASPNGAEAQASHAIQLWRVET